MKEMFSTFNMGIGMMMVVSKEDVERTVTALEKAGEKAFVIGNIEAMNDAGAGDTEDTDIRYRKVVLK